jgi:hypothetical protein
MHQTANFHQAVALNHAASCESADALKREFRCEGSAANSECYVPSKPTDQPLREPYPHSTSIYSSTDYSSVKSGPHFAFDATNLRGTSQRRLKDTPCCGINSLVPPTRYDDSIPRSAQVVQNADPRKITAGSSIDRVPAQHDICIRREKREKPSLISPSVAEDFVPKEICNRNNCNFIAKESPSHIFERGAPQISKTMSSVQQNITGTQISYESNHRAVSKSCMATDKRGLINSGQTKKCQKSSRKPKPKLALKEIKERELEIRSREMSRERTRCAMEKLFEEIRQLQVYQSSELHAILLM